MAESKPKLKDDFRLEYAKSARSACKHCKSKLEKDSVRVGILEPSDKFDGEYYVWHHVTCFFEKKGKVAVSKLKGLEDLRPDDQSKVRKLAGPAEAADNKKRKADDDDDDDNNDKKPKTDGKSEGGDDDMEVEEEETPNYSEEELKKIWELKDMLTATCNQNELKEMLKHNDQPEKGGKSDLAARVADGILRGTIPPCPSCNQNTLHFSGGKYVCHGHASAWSKCSFRSKDVERTKWKNVKWWAARKKAYEKKKAKEEEEKEEEEDDSFF